MVKRAHCEPAALAMRDDNARVARGKGSRPLGLAKRRREATGSPRCVGAARAADIRAGVLCDSNPCGGYFVHPLAKWMILLLISAFSRNCAYTDEGMQEHVVG